MNEDTKKEDNAIKAYRYDMTVPKYKKENCINVPDGIEKKTCFLCTSYTKEELDYGNYWEYSDCGTFYPKDSEGRYILEDAELIKDWFGIRECEGNINSLIDTLNNPHDWFEIKYGAGKNCILRVTALQDRPVICAEKCETDEISFEGLTKIKIYGKPIQEDGCMTGVGHLWIMNLQDEIMSSIRSRITNKDVVVNWNGFGFRTNCEEASIRFDISVAAKSVSDLKDALFCLGAKSIDDSMIKVKLEKGNDITDERMVFADICISNKSY